jgi:hypothetical protein
MLHVQGPYCAASHHADATIAKKCWLPWCRVMSTHQLAESAPYAVPFIHKGAHACLVCRNPSPLIVSSQNVPSRQSRLQPLRMCTLRVCSGTAQHAVAVLPRVLAGGSAHAAAAAAPPLAMGIAGDPIRAVLVMTDPR